MIDKQIIVHDNARMEKKIYKLLMRQDWENALKLIEFEGKLKYSTNQIYTCERLENYLKKIVESIIVPFEYRKENRKVLFYDGFGFDTRGLALIYLKALVKLGYDVVYVVDEKQKDEIPEIRKVLGESSASVIYCISMREKVKGIQQVLQISREEKIEKFILYTLPYDSIGIGCGIGLKNQVQRFLINLTDHAFWLGKNAFDYIIEFRDYGANISHYKRKIDKTVIIKLPYYPIISRNIDFEGFPFEKLDGQKVVFSGGAIYKTLGAGDLYYKIVEYIIEKHQDVIFYYAGSNSSKLLDELISKYPGRVFWGHERKDLFQLLQHCDLYLSTYPMIGGLMTQYAAAAGVLPMTLIYDECSTGVLIDPDSIGVEFRSSAAFLKEIDRVLDDEKYKAQKCHNLQKQIITVNDFEKNLDEILNNNFSNYLIDYADIDTSAFVKTYLERLDYLSYSELFVQKKYFKEAVSFPIRCFCGSISKIKRYISNVLSRNRVKCG